MASNISECISRTNCFEDTAANIGGKISEVDMGDIDGVKQVCQRIQLGSCASLRGLSITVFAPVHDSASSICFHLSKFGCWMVGLVVAVSG